MKLTIAVLESQEMSRDVFDYEVPNHTFINANNIDMALRRRLLATMHGGTEDPTLLSPITEVEQNDIGPATITHLIQTKGGYAFVGHDNDDEVEFVGMVYIVSHEQSQAADGS